MDPKTAVETILWETDIINYDTTPLSFRWDLSRYPTYGVPAHEIEKQLPGVYPHELKNSSQIIVNDGLGQPVFTCLLDGEARNEFSIPRFFDGISELVLLGGYNKVPFYYDTKNGTLFFAAREHRQYNRLHVGVVDGAHRDIEFYLQILKAGIQYIDTRDTNIIFDDLASFVAPRMIPGDVILLRGQPCATLHSSQLSPLVLHFLNSHGIKTIDQIINNSGDSSKHIMELLSAVMVDTTRVNVPQILTAIDRTIALASGSNLRKFLYVLATPNLFSQDTSKKLIDDIAGTEIALLLLSGEGLRVAGVSYLYRSDLIDVPTQVIIIGSNHSAIRDCYANNPDLTEVGYEFDFTARIQLANCALGYPIKTHEFDQELVAKLNNGRLPIGVTLIKARGKYDLANNVFHDQAGAQSLYNRLLRAQVENVQKLHTIGNKLTPIYLAG